MTSSKVYFFELSGNSTMQERINATKKVLEKSEITGTILEKHKVAVKIHVGEKNNDTHVAPEIIREIVSKIKSRKAAPFLVETSTLYKGERSNAIDHLIHAHNHGFGFEATGAPFIMADGLTGNTEIEVEIGGVIFKSVSIAREMAFADALIAVSHVTGHPASGIGACIKTLGMGLSSRKGKLRQHSSMKPKIDPPACTYCKKCIRWCPEEAIITQDDKAFILQDKCIGCGECLAVCNYDAVKYDWGMESADLQKRMAEHALGVIKGKENRSYFINYLTDMTKGCDCYNTKQEKIMNDVGILASRDPVAIEQATLDITKKHFKQSISEKSHPEVDPSIQLKHGEKIGLGSRSYEVVRI